MAGYHIDLSSSTFGVQEEKSLPARGERASPGMGEIQKGYLYGSVKAGLGLDTAANYPLGQIRGGGPYGTHRSLDGTVVKS
jgi:hypothetical protein